MTFVCRTSNIKSSKGKKFSHDICFAGLLDQSAALLDLCDNSDPRDVTTLIGWCSALRSCDLVTL